jgi:hypothetical protein
MFRFPDRLFLDGSNEEPSLNGKTVYVVIHVNRGRIACSVVDNQRDIEVCGVFLTRTAAKEYISSKDPLNDFPKYIIHEAKMNPHFIKRQLESMDTFHPEIYS